MTSKEQKGLKHSLKTDIDIAARWIALAVIGKEIGAKEDPKATQTREAIISNLQEIRASIQEKTQKYLETIDAAINTIS